MSSRLHHIRQTSRTTTLRSVCVYIILNEEGLPLAASSSSTQYAGTVALVRGCTSLGSLVATQPCSLS